MPHGLKDLDVFDIQAYMRASTQMRLAKERLPEPAIKNLADEVVRRLAFRVPNAGNDDVSPNQGDIDNLCQALLASDQDAADHLIRSVRRDGVALDTIYLSYIAAAARKMGEMWEDDSVSFVQVTLACGRLYSIIRGLRHVLAPQIANHREDRTVFFALVPDETHTLGIEMATDFFRREGWDVDLAVGQTHDEIIDQAELRNYKAVVLVANSDRMIEPLARLMLAMRIVQPVAQVVLAGNILDAHPEIPDLVGADAVMNDIETAVNQLKEIIAV